MTESIITLSDSAAEKVKSFISKAPEEDNIIGLRIGVENGGCSGMRYFLEYANDEHDGEDLIEEKGIKLFVEKSAILYLAGTEIDYDEGAFESRFVFKNPNETKRCGCGKSFKT